MRCNICGEASTPLAVARILGKYDAQYFACDSCGFIQTEAPYWLEEAYSDSIARSDIGLIGRNIKVAHVAAAVIATFFRPDQKFLDYGGGNGVFVRLMRDKGIDFYWFDKFTTNQFAVGFEGSVSQGYELVSAFEVFEHLPDPLAEIEKMLSNSDNILFSTTLVPARCPAPQDWWYYALDTGQHISLYSKQSLQTVARRFGLNFYTNGRSMHLLTRKQLPAAAFRLVSLPPLAVVLSTLLMLGRKSLLEDDYFRITGKHLK